jgi:hypothetical protein
MRTVVRFAVLTLDVIWREWTLTRARGPERPKPTQCGTSQVPEDQRSRRVACDCGGDQRDVSKFPKNSDAPT